MAGMLSMSAALKGFEKTGQVSRLTFDELYRLTIARKTVVSLAHDEPPSHGTSPVSNEYYYLLQVYRLPRKDAPKAERGEIIELEMRFDTLQKVLTVANQALQGGLETLLLFRRT